MTEPLHPDTPLAARYTELHREHARRLEEIVRLLNDAPGLLAEMLPYTAERFAVITIKKAASSLREEIDRMRVLGFGAEVKL